MLTQIIIHDVKMARRMVYVLNDDDFAGQKAKWHKSDDMLRSLKNHPFFAGREFWCDLEIEHFHVMIVNILKMLDNVPDDRADKHPLAERLTFLLCCLVSVLQDRTDSLITLMKINRVSADDVFYDYSASLEVVVSPPAPFVPLKLIV